MLKYLVQVTEDLMIVAVLTGLVFAFACRRWDKSGRRVVAVGSGVAWLAAAVLAYLKNATKLVDSGLWNLRFVGVYLVGLVLFLVLLVPRLAERLDTKGQRVQQVGLGLVLLGVTGYMAPEALGYPWAITLAVSEVASTDFFFRIVGWLAGFVLMFVLGYGTFKVLSSLKDRAVTCVSAAGAVLVGLLLGGLGLRALLTRRLIPQNHTVFQIAVLASNHVQTMGYVLLALSLACLVVVLVQSMHVSEPYANPAQHRKIRAKWRSRRRWSCVTLVCIVLSVVTVTAIKAYDSKEVELSPSEEFDLRDDGCYVSFEQLADEHLHRFTYESPDGVGIRFIIIKKPGSSSYGVGLDACDICGETGYYEREGQVVCKLCDVVMNIQTIGFKGGCNPIVIDYEIRDGYIYIPFDTLLEHEVIFTR